MKEKRTITREERQELVDEMNRRLEEVRDCEDEAADAVDWYLNKLGYEVEKPAIWEQKWWPVDNGNGTYSIKCGSGPLAIAYGEANKDFILGANALVRACLEAGEFYHQDDITRALRAMGVEVKE